MIRRLGIVGRLLTIGVLGFAALLVMLGLALYLLGQQENALQQRFPRPEQIAAIVELVERTPAAARTGVLAALNGADFSVAIAPGRPASSGDGRELPRLEDMLSAIAGDLSDRDVVIDIPDAGLHGRRPLLEAWTGLAPVRLQVGLKDGSHLVMVMKGAPTRRVLNTPTGFWLAALGLLIAGVTLFGLFRAARPLRQLTTALESFSETAAPVPVVPSGPADMQRLIATVNRMQERLSTLLRGRAMLAGAISHDLRTYLTRMRLRMDGIEDENERNGAEDDIEAMTGIVENALAFAQAASSTGLGDIVDLNEVVLAEVRADGRPGVTAAIAASPLSVRGDRVALRRVVANLIDNALLYAGDATVTLAVRDRLAELAVDDHGPGIPATERETVFEPFYRLETSRNRASGGTGLGLALTRQIVEAHGGRITASDAPDGGTRMRVLLPLA